MNVSGGPHMHWVIGVIRPTSLLAVRDKLLAIGIQSMTISECSGHGRQRGKKEIYRGHEYHITLVPKLRVEVACTKGELKQVLEAFESGARSSSGNKIGDGKVFVLGLDDVLRIRTGESGKDAI